MTGKPFFRRALALVGSAFLVTIRAVNWCFICQLPDNH